MTKNFYTLAVVFLCLSCSKEYSETQLDHTKYKLASTLQLEAIAAEPLLEAPVAISFDDNGQLWALELTGYMHNIEGTQEEEPVGRILILEDKDEDGLMDHTRVFLDSLKLARAFSHVYGGLLYAEPPFLFFTEIKSDNSPGKTTVVDSSYAVGGNVEHQPNGLLYNLDNWIYNAKSNKRYRLKDGKWLTQTTSFRGQWGITHDDMGRLLYNDNSNQLKGDWILPNMLDNNPKINTLKALRATIVANQKVYPVQATSINRGYLPNMLDKEQKVKNFTSACGPLYFEGTNLPNTFQGNAFVSGPEANLIKRNILENQALKLNGKQAYTNKEFLISMDENFRPVNNFNGPDGSLFVVDMHRGVIQHKTYMSGYLRQEYLKKGLDTVVGMGRILRIGKSLKPLRKLKISKWTNSQLIDSLASKNIWIRTRAQHHLVAKGTPKTIELLQEKIKKSKSRQQLIHLLYALSGLDAFTSNLFEIATLYQYPKAAAVAIKLAVDHNITLTPEQLDAFISMQHTMVDYYLGYYWSKQAKHHLDEKWLTLIGKYQEADWFIEPAVVNSLGHEQLYLQERYAAVLPNTQNQIDSLSKIPLPQPESVIFQDDNLTRGRTLFNQHCATCHGPDGRGITNLSPPLLNSEYVTGPKERFLAVMLYGLNGPVTVNGKRYNNGIAMPGIGGNPEITDENIRDIGNYIRNAFTHKAQQDVDLETIKELRQLDRKTDQSFREEELFELFKAN